jgi:hypothetical protein
MSAITEEPPYRAEFTKLHRPLGRNQQDATYTAVSANTSFLAVPTDLADAYHEVKKFHIDKQEQQSGLQQRLLGQVLPL